MTHGQSVSSCFYKGEKEKRKANKPQINSYSEIKESTYLQRKASHSN